jgi:hypothetical protein
MVIRREVKVGAVFCLVAILLRFPTFFASVIDHDESTYIIIADQWLKGLIPYVDNLDVKPPGIYALFASILTFFNSVFAIRVFASVVIAITGYLLYRSHLVLFSFRKVALASGILYIVCASAHKWSWSANTEIFFVCCSMACLYIILIARKFYHFILFGLIAATGFLIKFHIAFDIMALAIFYFFWGSQKVSGWVKHMLVAFVAFCLPVFALYLIYDQLGFESDLHFALLTIPASYQSEYDLTKVIRFIFEYHLSFLPLVFLLGYGVFLAWRKRWFLRSQWMLLLIWMVCAWIGILATGKLFFHYYFQALAPLCLFAFTFAMIRDKDQGWSSTFLRQYGVLTLSLIIPLLWINQYIQVVRKPDVPRMVANYLQPTWKDTDKLYTNDKNIIYYLLRTKPPTRYVHTSILYQPDLIRAYHIDVEKELKAIVAQKIDYYVLTNDVHPVILEDMEKYFDLEAEFPNIRLYRRVVSDP